MADVITLVRSLDVEGLAQLLSTSSENVNLNEALPLSSEVRVHGIKDRKISHLIHCAGLSAGIYARALGPNWWDSQF